MKRKLVTGHRDMHAAALIAPVPSVTVTMMMKMMMKIRRLVFTSQPM